MIKVTGLSFGYNRKKLLYQDLTMTMKNGRIYGLLGKNGAGKSTLLKNIAGTLFPVKGSVLIDDKVPGKRQPSFLRTIYYIPEEVHVPATSLKQYINLFAVFYPSFSLTLLHEYLKELEVVVPEKLNALSFGQQKKFIIAFALACNTKVLLMDEPTNGLDIPSKAQFRKLIASVMHENRIILISTHQTRDLENLIDEVIIIDNGHLLMQASMEEITQKFYFDTVSDITDCGKVIYAEKQLKGTAIVRDNHTGKDSRTNLEYLFNGVTQQPALANEILLTN